MADSGFFSSNRLVQVCSALDNFTLGSESEKNALLRNLNESADSFPPEFAMHRILPSLLKALEFGGASAATMLPLVIKFGKNVSSDEYQNTLVAPLVKLFASPDRGTRMALLDQLPEYVEKLDKKTVDKIFPHLVIFIQSLHIQWTDTMLSTANWIFRYCRSHSGSNCQIRHITSTQGLALCLGAVVAWLTSFIV